MRESVDESGSRGVSLPDERAEQPFEPFSRREKSQDVHRAIQGLSEKLREVVLLRYFEDLPYEDISQRLNVSIGTVKSRLFRAHESLQYWLAPTPDAQGRIYAPDALTEEHRHRWIDWLRTYRARLREDAVPPVVRRERMDAVNPKYVFRNYMAQLATDQAETIVQVD